jgi:glycosyltransferase involved in cell wall biosynthesis
MKKVLWLSPMLNHYKARFLSHLHKDYPLDITVMAGSGRTDQGDFQWKEETAFKLIRIPVEKRKFGMAALVRNEVGAIFNEFDWIMIPKEHKNLPLFLYLMWLRNKHASKGNHTRLFSYNHPIVMEGPQKAGPFSMLVDRFFYLNLDKVVFYTESAYRRMVSRSFIAPEKASFANNTIDTSEIDRCYEFCYPDPEQPTILFIGRLISNKKLPVLISYYQALKSKPALKKLKLIVIGDGPESSVVKNAAQADADIEWKGTITDEERIAPSMAKASLVFIPGHTGLSVNHALCYGRPIFTLGGQHQPPEIDYINSGENGLILNGTDQENVNAIASLLVNFAPEIYDSCYKVGRSLSVDSWCQNMSDALQK